MTQDNNVRTKINYVRYKVLTLERGSGGEVKQKNYGQYEIDTYKYESYPKQR